jgi:lysophospholipase L1-like esterase
MSNNRVLYSRAVLLICGAVAATSGLTARTEESAAAWRMSAEQLVPFWRSTTMYGESVLFVDRGDGLPHAALLFTPQRILSVCSASGDVTYEEGQDFTWKPGSRELYLPIGSRIIRKTPQDLRRPAGSQRYQLTHRDGNGEILFGGGHEYHDMQTVVTYVHEPDQWNGPKPAYAGEQLPRTLGKLTSRQSLAIALLGDSISTGCNASGWANVAPWQPPYQDLLVRNLKSVYGGEVTLRNHSVGGTDTAWGLQTIEDIASTKPDLVIIAFGMNDSAGRLPAEYKANTQGMIDAVRKSSPDTEFILVASMLGNRDWITLQHELFPQYRDMRAELRHNGIVLADMTSVWAELLRHKQDWDMTGNGVNHPNDFGHRVYAQVLSALLIP